MKKKFCKGLALLTALAAFSGCQNNLPDNIHKNGNDQKIDLTYFGYKADTTNLLAIEDAIQSFQLKHSNVNINYEGIKSGEYYEKLELRSRTGNLNDMFMVNHDSTLTLTERGVLEDLSDIVDPNKFIPAASSQFVNDDGSIYFIPTAMISFGLYCNLDLLSEHGFDTPPQTFSEFEEICDYFVGKGITPIIANNYSTSRTIILAKGMYDVYQQDDYSDTIKKINSGETDIVKQLKPGIELLHTMFQKGWMNGSEVASTAQTSDDLKLFKAGDRPFMFCGTWASPRIKGEGGVSFNYAIYPYPILDDGSVLVVDIATCMSVNSSGENKNIAKEFVAHMTEPDVIWSYCDSQSSFTPILGDNRLPNDTALQPQIEYLSNGRNVIGSNFKISLPLDNALHDVGLALMEGKSVNEAADLLRTKLAEYTQ